MKKIKIKQIDAFTSVPFSGNPAGVVTSASGLTVKQMKLIAREMNLSETAFVLPPKTPAADLEIRWFTPTSEVDICGHATIASFHALAEENKYGMSRSGKFNFNVETKSGILPVQVTKNGDLQPLISLGLPIPKFQTVRYKKNILGTAFSMETGGFESKYSMAKDDLYLIIAIKNRDTLFKIIPNYPLIEDICRELTVSGITLFTTDTIDSESMVHTRFFAPLLGVNEDPVTGSSLGPLGIYLAEQGIIKQKIGTISFVAEQGDVLDKPGRVTVEFQITPKGYQSLKILGNAVTVLNGEIYLE